MEYSSYKRIINGSIKQTMDYLYEKYEEIFYSTRDYNSPVFIIPYGKMNRLRWEVSLTESYKIPYKTPYKYRGIVICCEDFKLFGWDEETIRLMDSEYYNSIKKNVPAPEFSIFRHEKIIPERYIVNKGAVILFWENGTKTIVKRSHYDKHDPIKGFLWAYFERNSGMSKTQVKKYLMEVNNGKEQKRKK